jgi:hypothetical protein
MNNTYNSIYCVNRPKFIQFLIDKELTQSDFAKWMNVSPQRFHFMLKQDKFPMTEKAYKKLVDTLKKLGVKKTNDFFKKSRKPEGKQ